METRRQHPDREMDDTKTMVVQGEAVDPFFTNDELTEKEFDLIRKLNVRPHGKYDFYGMVASGGMKEILRVRDCDTSRHVAMAVLRKSGSRDQRFLSFVKEARVTAHLEHPNIVPIHEIGLDETDSPYFTMKLLKGMPLDKILDRLNEGEEKYVGVYTLPRLLSIFQKICDAIAFAHSRGIIHLDLKPDNVHVGEYGDVQVLDWGLAKIIDRTRKPVFEEFHRETMEGMTKGTPGYMSPEQAAGRNSKKDERTDVYSLGAILYAILTWKIPVTGDNVMHIISNTVAGEITPPRERAPERVVPPPIEAVVMKAMALRPEERYQCVDDLRNDVEAYVNGFATSAERAGLLKRGLLLVKRHLALSFALFVMAVFVALIIGYSVYDARLRERTWVSVFNMDFTKPRFNTANLAFGNRDNSRQVRPWYHEEGKGMKMRRFEWLWLKNRNITGDVRVVAEFFCGANPNTFEVCVNSANEPFKDRWEVPRGYSFQLGADQGDKDRVLKRVERTSGLVVLESESSAMTSGETGRLEVTRQGEVLSMSLNGRKIIKVFDVFPPKGDDLSRVGLRTLSSSMWLLSLRIDRLSLPAKASPLLAGDALVEHHHYREGIDTYLDIAENYGRKTVSQKAMIKAYATAATKRFEGREELLKRIRSKIKTAFPQFAFEDRLLELDAFLLWRDGKHQAALEIMPDLFMLKPETQVIPRMLQVPHEPLPKDVGEQLVRWIWRTRNLKKLDVSNFGLPSLEALRKIPLVELDCSGNDIESLEPLRDMPLKRLSLADCPKLRDLSPLRDVHSLESLTLPPNPGDVSFLSEMPNLKWIAAGADEEPKETKEFFTVESAGEHE